MCSQKEGLAQKYASLHLPLSAFQCRQGVMLEFCKHDLCCGAKYAHYDHLRLVLPIANFLSYCEALWKKIFDDQENFSNYFGCTTPKKSLSCGGRTHLQSLRKVLRTEEIGVVVLGRLKVSLSSGRLQLVDATGEVDILLDLPATWNFDKIFEAKDFRVIVEGMPPKLLGLGSTVYCPLSSRSIFSNALPLRRMKLSIYLHHYPTHEDSRSSSRFFDCQGNNQELDCGKFHMLKLTHKFPVLQKFEGDITKRPNVFAEAIVLPWDLLAAGKYGDARPENHLMHKRRKIEQASIEAYNNSSVEHTCVSNHPVELPCLVASKGVDFHYTGILSWTDENTKFVCGCKLPRRKVLLEFGPDSFYNYEVLKIGRCYLVKHQEGDALCSITENYQVGRAKVNISSGTHFRSFTFCNLHISSDFAISNGYRQLETPHLTDNDIDSDYSVFVPVNALYLQEYLTKILDNCHFDEEQNIHDHVRSVINASMQCSETPCSDYPLPKGNLITLCGLIVALHGCNSDSFPAQPRAIPVEGYLSTFLQGNGGVCVHVLVDNQMVRIFCDLSRQTFPVGLGRDAYATFHRILVISGQNKYMMTPVSFITINETSLTNEHLTDENNDAYKTMGLNSVPTSNTIPTTLISDALQISEPKSMQLRCRVVGVYILIMEKARTSAVFPSIVSSIPSTFGIPFAGFVMDDGSSSCCCWADSERASALLGLEFEKHLLKGSAETFGEAKAGAGQQYSSTTSQLNQMLENHGRVVVKNYGSVFDYSCQDLLFSVDSGRLISSSGEDLLRSLIANAICSTAWIIGGSFMDAKAFGWLEERLTELDVPLLPLMNIWATSIRHADVLAEARNIMKGLV